MGTEVPRGARGRDSGPVFCGVAPEIIEDTLIHLATENEQYVSELPEQAGCFKETRIVGEARHSSSRGSRTPSLGSCNECLLCFLQNLYSFWLKNGTWTCPHGTRQWSYLNGYNGCLLPAKPLHQLCVQLLDLCYLTRETIYDTLLKIALENSTPSKVQIARFLTVKEDFMLLAVGVISTGVFILSPGHWEQVQSLLKALAPWEHSAKVLYLFQHNKTQCQSGLSVVVPAQQLGMHWEGTPLSFRTKHVGFCQSCVLALAVEHLNCITGITPQSILEFSYAVVRPVLGSTTPEQHRATRSPQDRIPPQK